MFKKITLSLILCFIIIFMLLNPSMFSLKVTESIRLCLEGVIPSLFLFMVLSSFGVKSGCFEPVIRLFSPFCKVMNLSPNSFEAVFWGAFSGFPVGAKTAALLYKEGRISKREGEILLSFCNNCSPAFLIGLLGKTGFKIYCLQLICAFITAFIFTRLFKFTKTAFKRSLSLPQSPLNALSQSIGDGALGIIKVCAFITFMGAVFVVLGYFKIESPFLYGLIEITSGLRALNIYNSFSFGLACFISYFGSFSVFLQVYSFVNKEGLSMNTYILGKLLGAVLMFLLGFIFY